MTTLENFIQTPLAQALAWTLVHSLWQGGLVALVLGTGLQVTRSAHFRYLLACTALSVLFGAFCITLRHLLNTEAGPELSAALTLALPTLPAPDPDGRITGGLAQALVPWLTPLWIFGVLLFSATGTAGYCRARRLRHRGVCVAPAGWSSRLSELAAVLCIPRSIALLESAVATVPVVMGWFRPVIIFPIGMLTGMPAGQVEAILLHELAHVRRHDYLANLLQSAVESLLFYHPAVWWISSVMRRERENCCDDLVIRTRGDRLEYATALATLEQARSTFALAANGGDLRQRIGRLLEPATSTRTLPPTMPLALLVLASAVTLVAWQAGTAADTAWQRWVTEDAAFIAKPEERAAFQRLGTDKEREQFIEQFWLRRDPTPGTAVNEFKEEHYRRIAYSKQRFAGPGKPGWQTDRGRIYILYGPPDELEMHPAKTNARAAWRYRMIAGVGANVIIEFVDADGTGDYRQTSDPNQKK